VALMVWVYAIVLPSLLTITFKNFVDAGVQLRWSMLAVFLGGAAIGLIIVALT
jgi:hypothetical protein